MYLSKLLVCSPAHTATPESNPILQVCEGEGDGLRHTFFRITEGHHAGNKKGYMSRKVALESNFWDFFSSL